MSKDKHNTPVITSENLPEDVNKVLDELTEDQRRVLMGTMVAMEQRMYSGPLPPADEIAVYEQTCKGAADRIISMAEKSLSNRITNEQFIIKEEAKQVGRGQDLWVCISPLLWCYSLCFRFARSRCTSRDYCW